MMYKIHQLEPGKRKWAPKAAGLSSRREADSLKKALRELHPEIKFKVKKYGEK